MSIYIISSPELYTCQDIDLEYNAVRTTSHLHSKASYYYLPIAEANRSISDAPKSFIGKMTSSVNFGSLFSTRFSNASHDRSDPPLPLS